MKTVSQLTVNPGAIHVASQILLKSRTPSVFAVKKVSDISNDLSFLLDESFKSIKNCIIYKDDYRNPIVKYSNNPDFPTRISTFVAFIDGKNILLAGRENMKQSVENNTIDCFGSVSFNNSSLKFKIGEGLFNADIKKNFSVWNCAIENNDEENVVMIGWVVEVSSEDLQAGVIEGKTFISSIEDAKKIKNKSAKLDAALSDL